VFDLLASILAFFYDLVPNYAIAIALLTLTVMLALTPITLKGTRSMLAMQKLQPEMKRIQEMHKGDRQAQNEAMMAFYKEHKINPLSGCLPMLAQFPVLIVMFNVINKLVKYKTVDGVRIGTPSYLSHDSALYEALRDSGGRMKSFGVDFAATPSAAGRGAIVLYLLIVLVIATSYWQTHMMQSRSAANQNQMPQMQTMMKIMPLFSGLISFSLPGGVTLYFLISNLFRIAQQGLMYRFDPHLKAHLDEVREVKSRTANEPAAPRKGLFASMKEQAEERASQREGTGNGSRTNGASGSSTRPASGRVTQPGQRGNAPRKRSKRKR
jgi:YidC/Oxa1 family membrane protein insertase